MINRQIRLKRRPVGMPTTDDFELASDAVSAPADGEVLRRTIYLSLDPYMRGRMSGARSYAAPVSVGGLMVGHTVSQVIESRDPSFRPGDIVAGYDGWQEYTCTRPAGLRPLDRTLPMTTALGVLGMPGLTAYVGLIDIGQPKSGETVVVSAAAGAVGSVVGQLAKLRGCRAVGVAGSPEKCRYVVEDLGFDDCIDYKKGDLAAALRGACPGGIDVYFENVGGAVLDVVLQLINRGARIPLCGLISEYNAAGPPPPGPNLRPLLVNRALIRGFIISDHGDRAAAFMQECAPLVRSGRLRYREDIVEGLESAPQALIGLFEGRNLGKLIVRVSAEP
jgi:NADPH-dependent curcumin reductase CurA